jgi:hypothetical protein
MLSIIDRESISDSIAWARKAVAAGQSRIVTQGLVSLLLEVGTPQAISEAVEVAANAYSAAEPGRDKWRNAAYAYDTYQTVSRRFPGMLAPETADEFAGRVKQDSNWYAALQVLDDPARRPHSVRDALVTVCHLAGVFGDEPCMYGIEATVQAAIRFPHLPDAQILADAAALGMKAAPQGGSIVSPDTRTPVLIAWLDRFRNNQLDSLVVLDAIATVSRDRDLRRETRLEIVARNPTNGQARFELGKVYYDQQRWAEAVV